MQTERRTNPYPWTWEIPAGAAIVLLLVMVLAAHTARAAANLVAGAGWQLTPRTALFSSLPGLLGGDATAGLASAPTVAASPHALWVWIGAVEVVVLVGAALVLRVVMRRWGPSRVQGMASAAEAEQLLGISRLRRSAPVIRPDLHPTKARTP